MRTIWKFPIKATEVQGVDMPKGAELLTVQVQDGAPCVWAIVDTDEPKVRRLFETFGTGHPLPDGRVRSADRARFVGTYQLRGGAMVFHVFDGGEVPF